MKRGFKMAEHIIENDYLKVTIEDKGAELVSVYDKENNEMCIRDRLNLKQKLKKLESRFRI